MSSHKDAVLSDSLFFCGQRAKARKLMTLVGKGIIGTEEWQERHGQISDDNGYRTKTLLVDYWNNNKNVDLGVRKELGLDN